MSTAELQYFALMRAALWRQPVVLEGEPDWRGIVRIARHQATEALIADVASRLPEGSLPPVEILGEMKTLMRNNLISQLEMKQILGKAIAALRKRDIEPVVLKGFGLAALYPNPNLRQFGDIDLYVGLSRFHEACAILRSLPGCYNWGEEKDVGHQYNIEFGRHPMEVHRVSADVIDSKQAKIYANIECDGLKDHVRHAEFEGVELILPSKEFMVFFTFFHAWHHFTTSGVGWRQLSDMAITLHAYQGQLDLEKLRTWLSSMHLMDSWQVFGSLIVKYIGLPETEMPFFRTGNQRREQRVFNLIMEEGNFRRSNRFKQRNPKRRLAQKPHLFLCIFADFFQMVQVFPNHALHELSIAIKTGFWKKFSKKMNFFVCI